jgi:D-alanine transaminase
MLVTAPADNLILPGISRAHLIKACIKLGVPVFEVPYTLDRMLHADEIIVTSSSRFCLSACEIDGKAVGGKAPALLSAIREELIREFKAYINAA